MSKSVEQIVDSVLNRMREEVRLIPMDDAIKAWEILLAEAEVDHQALKEERG